MLFQPALLQVVIHWNVKLDYAFYFISKGVNSIATKKTVQSTEGRQVMQRCIRAK